MVPHFVKDEGKRKAVSHGANLTAHHSDDEVLSTLYRRHVNNTGCSDAGHHRGRGGEGEDRLWIEPILDRFQGAD